VLAISKVLQLVPKYPCLRSSRRPCLANRKPCSASSSLTPIVPTLETAQFRRGHYCLELTMPFPWSEVTGLFNQAQGRALCFFYSFYSTSNKSVRILALLVLLPAARAVPLHRARGKLNQMHTLHMKPLARFALFIQLTANHLSVTNIAAKTVSLFVRVHNLLLAIHVYPNL